MKVVKTFAVGVILFSFMPCIGLSQTDSNMVKENTELRERVDKLEKEFNELKKLMQQQTRPAVVETAAQSPNTVVTPSVTPSSTIPKLSDEDLQKILAMVQKETAAKKPVWSNLDIQLYGYIKVDAAYDTSRVNTGNYILWVDNDAGNSNDNEFNLTANQTRLGLKIAGPSDQQMKTTGLIEVDFYGGGAENKPQLMMRHAYMNFDWSDEQLSLLAGQTSDVISPLYPDTINYTVLWDGGNIGYRRPQVRLTKGFSLAQDIDLKLEGAIARTIGDDELSTVGTEKSGEDSGFPTLQGRTSITLPILPYKPTTVGFSGHWGEEEYGDRDFDTWSANLDLTQPISQWLTVKAEAFNGENLDTFFGGIGQGVRRIGTAYNNEIGAKGGWIAAGLGPWDKWRFNVGTGIDDVDRDDVGTGARTLNRSIFGNVIYAINKNAEVGLELSQWRTDYRGPGDADDFRTQAAVIYKF